MVRNPALWAALILLVIVLFGAKRLPDAVKSVAQSLKAFSQKWNQIQKTRRTKASQVTPTRSRL